MSNARKQYPDTSAGALAYLGEDSTLDLEGATARPDPAVEGVWEVTMPAENGRRAIVYLAGFRTPWGEARLWNDFEVEDRRG
jgi:hypothetical protein